MSGEIFLQVVVIYWQNDRLNILDWPAAFLFLARWAKYLSESSPILWEEIYLCWAGKVKKETFDVHLPVNYVRHVVDYVLQNTDYACYFSYWLIISSWGKIH